MTSTPFQKFLLLLLVGLTQNVLVSSLASASAIKAPSIATVDPFAKNNDSREYQKVEIIIYLHNNYKTSNHQWISSPLPDIPKQAIVLKYGKQEQSTNSETTDNTTPVLKAQIPPSDSIFTFLPETELVLKSEKNKLEASTRYTILHHFAWKQPAGADNKAQGLLAIRFIDEEKLDYLIQGTINIKHSQKNDNFTMSLTMHYCEIRDNEKHKNNIRDYLEKTTTSADKNTLDAFGSKLRAQEEKNIIQGTTSQVEAPEAISRIYLSIERYFEIKETREIKNIDQLQSFDGPIFSVLVKITPYLNLR